MLCTPILFAENSKTEDTRAALAPPKYGIIFRAEGVVYDSNYLLFEAWQQLFESLGITFTLEEFVPFVLETPQYILETICAKHGKEADINLLEEQKKRHELIKKEKCMVYQHAIDFIKDFGTRKKELNVTLGLLVHATSEEIQALVGQLGSEVVFDMLMSELDGYLHFPPRPDGTTPADDMPDYINVHKPQQKSFPRPLEELYQEMAEKMGVECKRCLVFESTQAGIEAATKLGMTILAVPTIYTKEYDFVGASAILNSFEGLDIQIAGKETNTSQALQEVTA